METAVRDRVVVWEGRPTAASFSGYYATYSMPLLGLAAVWLLIQYSPPRVVDALSTLAGLASWAFPGLSGPLLVVYMGGAALTLLIGIAVWVVKVSLKPLLYYSVLYVGVEAARYLLAAAWGFWERAMLVGAVTLAALVAVDLYRRSFHYVITRHTVSIRGGLLSSTERSVMISKINDVVVVKPFLGKLLGYGHVIPVTATQIGLGETFSLTGVAAKVPKTPVEVGVGGGRSIVDFRPRPNNSLFGVREPVMVREILVRLASLGEEYLRESAERLRSIDEKLGRQGSEK